MASAAEAATAKQGLASSLADGVETLSNQDSVVFTQYSRLVLPLDGSVYWVKTANTFTAQGSFHYSTTQAQNEAETEGTNAVVFTSLQPVQQFNELQPSTLYIGAYAGDNAGYDSPITFAFSQRGRYYKAADLYHYSGTAVLPSLSTQLINSSSDVSALVPVVSNSLPIWLSLNSYVPPYPGFVTGLTLYPSFLVPDNLVPPFGVVHIEPTKTESMQAGYNFGTTLSQAMLAQDNVRVTIYGQTNDLALTFLAAVQQFSYDYNTLGMVGMPVIRDEKRTALELGVIAMKKTIEFDVSYNQQTTRAVARQLIYECVNAYFPLALAADVGPEEPVQQPVGTYNLVTSQATATTTVSVLCPARIGPPGVGRVAVTLANAGSVTVYVGGQGVTILTGVPIPVGGSAAFNTVAAIYGLTQSGSGLVAIAETY